MASVAELQILLTASDNASAQLRAIGQDVQRLERQVEGVQRRTAGGGLLGGLQLGAGVAAVERALGAIGGLAGFAAESIFGLNSRLEQATATLTAFTGSAAQAQDIIEALRQNADITPFSTDEVVRAGSALISTARGSKEALLDLLGTAEALAAFRPLQGLESAVFSLREAISGDMTSIVDRFDLSRVAIQRFRDQGLSNLEAVRAEMQRVGATTALIEQLGQTFEGRASTIRSFFDEFRRRLGEGVFQRVSDAFGHMVNLIATHGDRLLRLAADVGQAVGAILQRVAQAAAGPLQALVEAFAPGLWEQIADEFERVAEPMRDVERAASQAAPAARNLNRELAGIGVAAAELQLQATGVRQSYDAQIQPLERQLRLLQQSADLQRVQNGLASNRAAVEGMRLEREVTALQRAAGGATDPNQAGLTTRQRLIALALQERRLRQEELGIEEQRRPAIQSLEQQLAALQEQQRQALKPLEDQLQAHRNNADALQLERQKAELLKQDLEGAAEAARQVGTGPAAPAALTDSRARGEALADEWLTGFKAWIEKGGGTVWGAIGASLQAWYDKDGTAQAQRIGKDLGTSLGTAAAQAVGPALLEALKTSLFPGGAPQAGGSFNPGAGLPRVGFDPTGRMGQPAAGPNVSVNVAVQPGSPLTEDQVRRLADEAAAALADSLAQAAAGTDPGPNRLVQGAGR